MFKRANKITALLVAAASVMSIVPAMASTRIGTKDGHITGGAIAYADGKYIYDGYRTDEDDNGIYYNNGSDEKEKFDEDLRDYNLQSKYGTKYAYGVDGNDQYLIDLSTGKTVDEETPEDRADSIKSKLKSVLKKTDRYSNTNLWDTVTLGDENNNVDTRLFGSKFGDVWYYYTAEGDKTATAPTIGSVAKEASFTIKLPTSYAVGTPVVVGGGAGITGTSLSDLYTNILAKVKADVKVTNVFDGKIEIVGSTIVGKTLAKGEISKTNAALVTFANVYGVTLAGETDTATITESSDNLNLAKAEADTLSTSTSSNQDVATSTVLNKTVTISRGSALGKTTITVKDSTAKVATISVEVTSAAGVTTMTTTPHPYVDSVTATAALAVVSNSGTVKDATEQTFKDLGLGDLVTTAGSTGANPTLSVPEAKDAITAYIATGKLGAAIPDAATVRTILEAKLATKVAAQKSTDQVTVDRGANTVDGALGNPDRYLGFVNEDGKYIDISATANVYIYSKAAQKTVKVKEYNKENADYGITVGLASVRVLAQDKDYIYTLTKVGVTEKDPTTKVAGPIEEQYFIQKISKAQEGTKDGAKLPKSVDSYQVDNKTIFDNGDAEKVYQLLVTGVDGDSFATKNVSAIDGNLYITGSKDDGDHDKVKVFKVVLKKAKINTVTTYGQGKHEDVDVYIAKKDADKDIDAAASGHGLAFDIEGNAWVLNKGLITKFTGTDTKEMYTCDRTFDNIDVYDSNNLIVWDTASDVYSNVAEGTKVTAGEATAVAPAVVTGWVQGTDGTWTFNDVTGTKVTAKWINDKGVWYFLKADGIMATGWYNDNGTWYFLNASGAMQTGWLNDNGTWYYLAGSGAMLANTTVDGYVLGASGAWIK